MPTDPFALKRQQMRDEFFAKLFLLGGWLGGTDTYKRTMWSAVPEIALQHAAYTLTFRRGLPESGANNRLVMAGHEAMLAQWFNRPLKRSDIARASKERRPLAQLVALIVEDALATDRGAKPEPRHAA